MHNFFVDKIQINEKSNQIVIKKDVNHIKNVLRCKKGEKINVNINETGQKYLCEISEFYEDSVICNIEEEILKSSEAKIHINIIQGIPKFDKMELIIQKCTELGVSEFTPLELKRCIVKLKESDKLKKLERWQKIAEVAAKQSGRNAVPKINSIQNIKTIKEILSDYDLVIVTYEGELNNTLKSELNNFKGSKIAIIIGPEGGFEQEEIKQFEELNVKSVSLGKRILRTETTALVVTSILMYLLDDLGGM